MTVTNRAHETTFAYPTDREIVMTRVFDAPRELVFEALTSCEHLPHWLGPRVWTMSHCQIDLRPEGAWRYEWTGPEGEAFGLSGVYREIEPPDRLESTEVMDDFPDELLNTIVLSEEDGHTTMTTTILYPSKDSRDGVMKSGMQDGVIESYDRLDDYLHTLQLKG